MREILSCAPSANGKFDSEGTKKIIMLFVYLNIYYTHIDPLSSCSHYRYRSEGERPETQHETPSSNYISTVAVAVDNTSYS